MPKLPGDCVGATGFVIERRNKRFLSRSMCWVRKRANPQERAIQQAWVHTEKAVLRGGNWASKVVLIYPARYNPCKDCTEIMGMPMSPEQFFERFETVSLAAIA